jgi:hypothetical protein
MVEAIGVPALYVKDATLERIEEKLNALLANREAEVRRLLALRERVWAQYTGLVRKSLNKTAKI